jgi:hypothetical protein
MERLAKEAKQATDQPPEKGISTVQDALDRIKSKTKAKAALKELVKAGFDETTIVQIVLSYCGGTEERVKTLHAVCKGTPREGPFHPRK